MLSFLSLGFLIGLWHALEPDHLAAVASLVAKGGTARERARTGALWGLGHAATLLLLGGTCVALGLTIPAAVERLLETAVGLMLVGLGVSVVLRLRRSGVHLHAHTHAGGRVHVHAHAHAEKLDHVRDPHEHAHHASRRTLLVGALHGLAGSAALVLLVGSAARSPLAGLATVLAFGLGAAAGMTVLAASVALPLRTSARRRTALFRGFCGVAGASSILIGGRIVWSYLQAS